MVIHTKPQPSPLQVAAVVVIGAAAVLLAGCAAVAPFGITEFTQEQSTEDQLPAEVQSSSFDSSTSRLVGESEGVTYFAVRSEGDICLVVFVTADIWGSGCSPELPIDIALDGYPMARLNSVAIESDAWHPIGQNLSLEKQ